MFLFGTRCSLNAKIILVDHDNYSLSSSVTKPVIVTLKLIVENLEHAFYIQSIDQNVD